jgi:WD40 repeat protein
MKQNRILLGTILIIILTACAGAPPTPTLPASDEITPMPADDTPEQVTTPTLKPSVTYTPTLTSESRIDPAIILPGNAIQVTELARLGKGTILSDPSYAPEGMPIYSPNGSWMAIPTSVGIYIYDSVTIEELRRIPVATPFIAFSPDSRLLAASKRGAISLWDPVTGVQVGELPGNPEDYHWELSFSPDGSLLSAITPRREVCIWSLASNEKLFTFPGDRLRFSPDGELAVTIVYGENQVHLYETHSGTEVNQWNVRNAGFAPGGQLWLADDESVRLVYVDRNQVTSPFSGVQPSFSADGTLMTLFDHNQISLYDHQKGRRVQMLEGSYIRIDRVLFSPDGLTLAGDVYTLLCPTCTELDGWDRYLILWRIADGSIIARIKHPSGWIAYSVDGSAINAMELESFQIIKTANGSIVKRIDGFTNPVEGMALSPDGNILATVQAAGEYTLRLWDLETSGVQRAFQGRDFSLSNVQVSYSPDGSYLAVGGDLWDLSAGERLTKLEFAIGEKTSCWPSYVTFSPDGKTLATGCFEGQLDLWNFPDGTLLKSIGGYNSWVNELAFSPNGENLAAIYNVPDYLVQVWQLPGGNPSFTLTGGHFTRVTYSWDGRTLATVIANEEYDQYGWPAGFVQLWDTLEGKEISALEVEDAVSIAFSPDNRTLATGSLDGTLRLWEIPAGRLLLETSGHYGSILRLAFTPDGTRLVTGSTDGTVAVWGIPAAR